LHSRLEFVRTQGWISSATFSDLDEYDDHPQTLYVIARNPNEPDVARAGLRLTRVSSFDVALSMKMLRSAPDMQRQGLAAGRSRGLLGARDGTSPVYDLTRLVISPSLCSNSPGSWMESLLDMIAMALFATDTLRNDTPWIFLTVPAIRKLVVSLGVQQAVLAEGRVTPVDPSDAHLMAVWPSRFEELGIGPTSREFPRQARNRVLETMGRITAIRG
jgi:hypothetical protein